MGITLFALVYGYLNNREWQVKIEQPLYDDPIVYSRASQYQHITITHYKPLDEIRLFLNGNLQLCSTDEVRYHEPLVHPAMALAKVKSRVLILGGGDGCALREVLKYKTVKEVMLVDLDPAMTTLAATHPLLVRMNQNAFKDARNTILSAKGVTPGPDRQLYMNTPKNRRRDQISSDSAAPGGASRGTVSNQHLADVKVMNIDADKFLEKIPGYWDVIIVDMPDPSTPELAKLYSREFYKKIKQHLSQNGIMVVQSTSPYLAKESFLCIGRTIENAGFTILPFHENVPSFGDWGWHLAWHPGIQKRKIMDRIKTLSFSVETRFLTPELFKGELAFGRGVLETDRQEINTILYPVLLTIYNHDSWLLE
jgi:spermidine synthase